jgi:NAD(P)H-flavin reductase
MAGIRGRVMEVVEADMEWNVSILLERDISVLPGQYLKVRLAESGQLFSSTVFPIIVLGTRLQVLPISRPNWSAGEEIQVYGPFGKGFILPNHKSRVGIYVPTATPALCLLP